MFKLIKKYSVQEKRFEFGGWRRSVVIVFLLNIAPAIIVALVVYYRMSHYSFYEYLNTFGNDNVYKNLVIIAGVFFQYAATATIMLNIISFFVFWRDSINKEPMGKKVIEMVVFSIISLFNIFIFSITFIGIGVSSGILPDLHKNYQSYAALVIQANNTPNQCEFRKGGYGHTVSLIDGRVIDSRIRNITNGDVFPCDYGKISKMVSSDFKWLSNENNEINTIIKNNFTGNKDFWINKDVDLRQGKYRINITDVQDANK